ncbi:MAG: ABC transporter permease, partial [Acidobacteria bacterium]|nr:ABC transporter permease [Acidobacteriota bacterium]
RGFSAVAALTLAMGIAANVNVFALVRSVLFAEPPYRAPAELFQLIPADHMATSPLELADVDGLKQIPGITQAAACVSPELSSRRTDPTLLVSATEVSRDFFALYDATPRVGRTLQPADFEPGVRNAVISYELWTVLLGRNPEVVGSRIELSRQSFTVVGVMPQAFAPSCFDSASRRHAWIAIGSTGNARVRSVSIAARVRADEPLSVVQARLDLYGIRRAEETGRTSYAGMFLRQVGVDPEHDGHPGLLLLQALAACLLLIACANWGSLFLLDASRRDTELLTRAYLGATSGRIVRQLLLESTVIAIIGGALGVSTSLIVASVMRSMLVPFASRGAAYEVSLGDAMVGVLAGIMMSLIFATFAAGVAARRARVAGGKTETQTTAGRSVRRFQHTLVAVQVGLSVVLAMATTMVGLSYLKTVNMNIGFDAKGIATSIAYLPPEAVTTGRARATQRAIADELLRADHSLDVAFSNTPAFASGGNVRVAVDNTGTTAPRALSTNIKMVSPNYFDVMRMSLVRGRRPQPRADGDVSEAVATVSFAKLLGSDDAVLGRVVQADDARRAAFVEHYGTSAFRIVGIVPDVSTTWLWKAEGPTLYVDLDRRSTSQLSVLVRTRDVPKTTALLQSVIAHVVPDAPEVAAESLSALVWRSEAERRFYLVAAAAFALVAMMIAGVGTYTAVRRMVALRTKEFAIRMSLGAAPGRLQASALRTALMPVCAGVAGGLLAALWLGSVARSVQSTSVIIAVVNRTAPAVAPTATAVVLGVLLLAALACWLPARRIASVDPAVLMKG